MVVDDKVEGYAVVPGGIRGLEVRAVERTLSDALRRLVVGHSAKVETWMARSSVANCYFDGRGWWVEGVTCELQFELEV